MSLISQALSEAVQAEVDAATKPLHAEIERLRERGNISAERRRHGWWLVYDGGSRWVCAEQEMSPPQDDVLARVMKRLRIRCEEIDGERVWMSNAERDAILAALDKKGGAAP